MRAVIDNILGLTCWWVIWDSDSQPKLIKNLAFGLKIIVAIFSSSL